MTAALAVDLEDAARRRFAGPVEFLLSAPELQYLPPASVAEIALAGRSNVGKSSLLNAITGRHGLARTSVTPGRTQELNIFDIGAPPQFRLVDMPGYGFADAPRDVVARWQRLVFDYLRGRAVLRRVLVLIDARHGIKPVDREIMALMDKAAVSFQLVLTKADKIKPSQLAAVHDATMAGARSHAAAHPHVIATSSEHGAGIPALRAAILAAATGQ